MQAMTCLEIYFHFRENEWYTGIIIAKLYCDRNCIAIIQQIRNNKRNEFPAKLIY